MDLASRAEQLWRVWEMRFRRRLVGAEGLIITGDEMVAGWTEAMSDAGAAHEVLTIEEAAKRLPIAQPAGSMALYDPSAGPTRARRTVECLQAVCEASLRREEVVTIDGTTTACTVSTSAGIWECDEIIIAGGIETGRLAATAGIGLATRIVYDSRFTYSIRDGYRDQPLACWIDKSAVYGPGCTSYGQRIGSTNLYAVGISGGDADGLTPDEESDRHRQNSMGYMPEAYPGLDPVPVDEIRCSHALRMVRDDGDGFMARRSGGITALYGNNLFKFAPLLGQLLSKTALTGALADDLVLDGLAVT